jgi:hypothetical protein
MDKNAAAQSVADKLIDAERAIDAAMIETSQMLEAMLQTRVDLHLSSTAADVAVARAAEAVAALAEARRAASATHAALTKVNREYGFGVETTAFKALPMSASANDLRIAS